MAEESKIKLSKTRIERKCGMGDKNPLRMKGGHSEKTKQYLIEVRGSKVLQYNSQGEFIQEYRSTHDCSGFVQVSVARCCRGENLTYKGFIFIYKDDYSSEYLEQRINKSNNKSATGLSEKIEKLDNNGNIVAIFKSLTNCALQEGFSRFKLTHHIKQDKLLNNYNYRYAV